MEHVIVFLRTMQHWDENLVESCKNIANMLEKMLLNTIKYNALRRWWRLSNTSRGGYEAKAKFIKDAQDEVRLRMVKEEHNIVDQRINGI